MNALRFSVYAAIEILLLAGCAKHEAAARTREDFCLDWAKAACTKDVLSACQAKSAEDCHASQEAFCRKLVPEDFVDSHGNGNACIDAVQAAYADADLKDDELATVLALGGPCAHLVVGPKSEGESCTKDSDCDQSADFSCVKKAGSAKGACEVPHPVEPGRGCSAVQETCSEDFYCDGEHCVEAKNDGDDCTIQEECGSGGYCTADGKCAARLATGESCTADDQCKTGICYVFESDRVCTDRIVLGRAEPLCDDLR